VLPSAVQNLLSLVKFLLSEAIRDSALAQFLTISPAAAPRASQAGAVCKVGDFMIPHRFESQRKLFLSQRPKLRLNSGA
jgi:hypothetical protein